MKIYMKIGDPTSDLPDSSQPALPPQHGDTILCVSCVLCVEFDNCELCVLCVLCVGSCIVLYGVCDHVLCVLTSTGLSVVLWEGLSVRPSIQEISFDSALPTRSALPSCKAVWELCSPNIQRAACFLLDRKYTS